MSKRTIEEMLEWRDEMRAEAYEDDRHERRMRDYDDDLFCETVDSLMEDTVFLDYKKELHSLCCTYGRDFDGWWEYSLDSL